MTYLLDVNILIALVDPDHTHHNLAHEWFMETAAASWATCPITENGVMRIVTGSRYPGRSITMDMATTSLRSLKSLHGHEFWPDDISLIDHPLVSLDRLPRSQQITDTYLLALAASRKASFATFDQRVDKNTVVDGSLHLCIVPLIR